MNTKSEIHEQNGVFYDYKNQAWVVSGVYARCGHLDCDGKDYAGRVRCYGTLHEGEIPTAEIIREYKDRHKAEGSSITAAYLEITRINKEQGL